MELLQKLEKAGADDQQNETVESARPAYLLRASGGGGGGASAGVRGVSAVGVQGVAVRVDRRGICRRVDAARMRAAQGFDVQKCY